MAFYKLCLMGCFCLVDRILTLMNENGVNAVTLTSDLCLANSSVTDWKRGKSKPGTETIIKLADYFNVSTDWILTGKEPRLHQIGDASNTVSGNGIAFAHGVNHGSVIIRDGQGKQLSDEAGELLRIYELLDLKRRLKILDLAVTLEEEQA